MNYRLKEVSVCVFDVVLSESNRGIEIVVLLQFIKRRVVANLRNVTPGQPNPGEVTPVKDGRTRRIVC